MPACSGSAGYQGYLILGSNILPYLSSDLAEVTELIMSQSIHGGGVSNINPVFRSMINYSIGKKRAAGTVNTEVFAGTGSYANAWISIMQRAIPSATDQSLVCQGFDASVTPLIFSPGGGSEIKCPAAAAANGKCIVASLELNGNNGGNVLSNFSVLSAGSDYNTTNANKPTAGQLAFESPGLTDDSNPVPWYSSNFTVTGAGETLTDNIIDWKISVNNNPIEVFAFDGNNFAQDIIIGMQVVTGSFSYYAANGVFTRNLTHGAVGQITFGTTTINMPFMAFNASPVPSPGPNAITIRNVTFSAVAAGPALPAIYHS